MVRFGNWIRLSEKGQLKGASDRLVSAEQMELARLRAELARVKIERDILKKRRRTSRGNPGEVRLDCPAQGALADRPVESTPSHGLPVTPVTPYGIAAP